MTDILKMAELFFSFVLGQRQSIGSRTQEISGEIINQIRRVSILLVITIGALTLFCMGASHLIERILNNLDKGLFILSPAVWVIFTFLIFCLCILVYSTNKKVWMRMLKKDKVESEPKGLGSGQLESVISLLVLDILKERELSRRVESP